MNKYQGNFISKTVRVVGLDIHNNNFSKGDHVRLFAQDDKLVKVMIDNNTKFKVLGYLHHEHSKCLHTVLEKYENLRDKNDLLSHIGYTLGEGDSKEVLIEIDFYNISDEAKRFIYDIMNILENIPGRIKNINDQYQ